MTPNTNTVQAATLPSDAEAWKVFNSRYDAAAKVYHWISRLLGAALIFLGVAKAQGGWVAEALGGIQIFDEDGATGEGGAPATDDERRMLQRGVALLLMLVGTYIIVYTLPGRKKEGEKRD